VAWWFLTSVPDETERRNDGDGKKMVLSMAEFGESQHGLRKAGCAHVFVQGVAREFLRYSHPNGEA